MSLQVIVEAKNVSRTLERIVSDSEVCLMTGICCWLITLQGSSHFLLSYAVIVSDRRPQSVCQRGQSLPRQQMLCPFSTFSTRLLMTCGARRQADNYQGGAAGAWQADHKHGGITKQIQHSEGEQGRDVHWSCWTLRGSDFVKEVIIP